MQSYSLMNEGQCNTLLKFSAVDVIVNKKLDEDGCLLGCSAV
jgi:hypothetical protein